MRIEGPRATGIGAYQKRQEQIRPATAAARLDPATEIAIAGIPESELTPRVQQAILTLMAEVSRLREELARSNERLEELERLADEDPLTGLFNRRAFVREVTRFAAYADRYRTPSSILFFDVNDLKVLNDTYGHETGDQALLHVARRLRANVRSTDVVGRLGGDEFGVLLVNVDAADAQAQGQRLTQAVEAEPFVVDGREHRVRVAWGWHTIAQGTDVGDALKAADASMYRQKRGRSAA